MSKPVIIPPEQSGERIDRALAALTGETRSAIARALKRGRVSKEGSTAPVTKNAIAVKTGERYTLTPAPADELLGDSIPVDFATQIIHEDEAILVLNKHAGQVVHPSAGQTINTIAQAVVARDPQIAAARYDDTVVSRLRPGIVHRLDKATSGIVVIAKTKPALLALQKQFKDRTIQKEYAAVVYGSVTEPFSVDAPIARHPIHRQRQAVVLTGKPAQTTFTPQKTGIIDSMPLTYLRAKPVTGRTHQIRVHLQHAGYPILGDPVYHTKASIAAAAALPVYNLLLHAARLTLIHPLTGDTISYAAPLPSYFVDLLERF